MLWGGSKGGIEVRSGEEGSTVLAGRFPYSVPTVLQGGRDRRREVFQARAFGDSVADEADIHLLVHHDFDRPLASRSAGSLTLIDDDDALSFEARLAPDMRNVSYVSDFLGTLAAGLVGGISPGFRVPDGGAIVKRDGTGLMRVVNTAELVEISAVTKPAYPLAQVEARNWQPVGQVARQAVDRHPSSRWR
ncbi:HK97 family phage prohead protease [Pseudoruegeria sp. HB172150]|uniref:HK97 family phage prohead protease n=1 Tax=Pseudoruegeria sp. HB172150 TaxID=2721164 RepID=UPI0015560AAF|nr:HK97 family phage prohead protease [Pseudoruegeria sp. HB172150]